MLASACPGLQDDHGYAGNAGEQPWTCRHQLRRQQRRSQLRVKGQPSPRLPSQTVVHDAYVPQQSRLYPAAYGTGLVSRDHRTEGLRGHLHTASQAHRAVKAG